MVLEEDTDDEYLTEDVDEQEKELQELGELRKMMMQHTWVELAEIAREGNVQQLDLMGTFCKEQDKCQEFADYLAKDSNLLALDLAHTSLSEKHAEILINGMCKNEFMKSFIVGGNYLGKECCAAVSNLLKENRSLEILDLGGSDIDHEGARILAEGLLTNSGSLTTLDLGGNHIGNEGAKAFGEVLKRCHQNFNLLDLVSNDITEIGAHHLAEAVKECENLGKLRLNSNKIGDTGALHFAAAIRNNPKTCLLELCDCDITMMGKGYIDAATEATSRPPEATDISSNIWDKPARQESSSEEEEEEPPRISCRKRAGAGLGRVFRAVRCGRRWRPSVPLAEQVETCEADAIL